MKFNVFFTIFIGIVLIGISIGYVIGYCFGSFLHYDYLFYLSVPLMGIGCFLSIYGSLFLTNKE